MSNRVSQSETQPQRRMRIDAQVNRDKLVAAARALFTAKSTSAPLEEVAERAGVGIGTLYRHFPTRQALLEAVYVDEVEAMARAAQDLAVLPPWDALSQWLHQYVGFAATKRALNEALMETDPESRVLLTCRTAIAGAGTALVERAQRAGVVRSRHELHGRRADGRRDRAGADRGRRAEAAPARAGARRAPLPPARLGVSARAEPRTSGSPGRRR